MQNGGWAERQGSRPASPSALPGRGACGVPKSRKGVGEKAEGGGVLTEKQLQKDPGAPLEE